MSDRTMGDAGRAAVLPTFVIVGAMRSGSTSLYKHMAAHPQIFMPRKEIHFFDRRWDNGLEWYGHRFDGYAGQPAVGEATPTYMSDPVALARMGEVIPDARLLAILRDPVERAYSHYWMEHVRGRDERTFAEAVADEAAGEGDSDYLARGRYAAQLAAVTDVYPREQVRAVLLDDLRDRPEATYAEVCRWLGVDGGYTPDKLGTRVNRYVGFRSMKVRGLRRRLPKAFKVGRIVGKLNAIEGEYPPMDEDLARDLRATFADDNAALSTWLGRDLTRWTEGRA